MHLYHDDLNFTAIDKVPSIYSEKRKHALQEALEECSADSERPAFVFGYATKIRFHAHYSFSDFNTRLDGDIVHWIKEKFCSNQNHMGSDEHLSMDERSFSFKHDNVFDDVSVIPEILQFDREIHRFNNSQVMHYLLFFTLNIF